MKLGSIIVVCDKLLPKMHTERNAKVLGVTTVGRKVLLFYSLLQDAQPIIQLDSSSDGYSFNKYRANLDISSRGKIKVNVTQCSNLHISKFGKKHLLAFKLRQKKQEYLNIAVSDDLWHFRKIGKISTLKETGMIVPNYKFRRKYVLYYGEKSINIAFSENLKTWQIPQKIVLEPQSDYNQDSLFKIGTLLSTDEGILIIYSSQNNYDGHIKLSLRAALFDKKNPEKLLWRSLAPFWELPEEWIKKKITLVGVVVLNGKLISYWNTEDGIMAVDLPSVKQLLDWKPSLSSLLLNRVKENPILKPILNHFWESKAVFNAAALYDKDKVHLIYRAIGNQDTSVLGYAASPDGINIDKRLEEPAYLPIPLEHKIPSFSPFPSVYISGGGGYGGCEDPRLTKIKDRIYMTYVTYDGCNPPRVALTSIEADEFYNQRWNWEKPVLISPPGMVDKNACILSEKIKEKYVIFHRIFPNILIDFVDDLNFDGKTKWLKGDFAIKPRSTFWDSRKVGVGPPPIKTDDGWLLIYHGVGDQDPARYKVGAMLLDLNDPTRVLYRSNRPILEPVEKYENEGFKSGVVYPCGAVDINNQLLVYYGGADMVLCAASANLSDFIGELKYSGEATLRPIKLSKVRN